MRATVKDSIITTYQNVDAVYTEVLKSIVIDISRIEPEDRTKLEKAILSKIKIALQAVKDLKR